MVEVSEKFRKLALDNGRHVYCRIIADGVEFLDDRLMEFSFDDVTHPDWFTVGTACANRFHFKARYSGELSAGAEVRPYISFDNEEWCPLGVFYISRRYVRGNTVSVTAYDRMYSLDMEFSYEGMLPTTSDALIAEICTAHGLQLASDIGSHEITCIPGLCTVRDMLGYIAALDRACAKIDRYGNLVFRSVSFNATSEHIADKNCMDIRRNLTRSVVTCLKCETETELLISGAGAEISTLELYDPLMTQKQLDQMYSMFKPFGFYGADVEMQGLPYLESGEGTYLLDGAMAYPIVISEIEFFYDGALTAVLYSRNKTNVEALVYEDDLEETLKKLKQMLSVTAFKYVNEQQIAIGTEPVTAAEFLFRTNGEGFAQLDVNISLSQSTANFTAYKIYVNGVEADRSIIHVPEDVSRTMVHIHHLEQYLKAGENKITVTVQTGSGEAYILPKAMLAALVVHGMGGISDGLRDRLAIAEKLSPVNAAALNVSFAAITDSADIQ